MSLHEFLKNHAACKAHRNLLNSVVLISISSISDKAISAIIVTEEDDVYALGCGCYGGIKYNNLQTKITPLCKQRTRFIDITSENTFAITKDGQLYIWGDGSSGIIGHGKQTSEFTPCHVSALKDEKVVGISVVYHVLAVTESGKVYAWGFNGNRQIGNGTGYNRQLSPFQVDLKEKVEQVSAGACHSLASTGDSKYTVNFNF
jgi:alpha-tubulin suppressor-like RCC1 family protein